MKLLTGEIKIETLNPLKSGNILIILAIVSFVFAFSFLMNSALAVPTDCWQWDNNETGCLENTDVCSWNSPWCDEIGCWNFQNETVCDSAASSGIACIWRNQTSGPSGFCELPGCWSYWNESECTSAPAELGCSWNSQGQFCNQQGCWDYGSNQTECEGDSRCTWNSQYSSCEEPGCWNYDYTNSSACEAAFNGTCTWDASNNMCMEQGCSNFWNQTACGSNESLILGCEWSNFTGPGGEGWCEGVDCWYWDTNSSGCTTYANETYGLNCSYDAGSQSCYPNFAGCTDHSNQNDCTSTGYCVWNSTNSTCEDPVGGGTFQNPDCWVFTQAGQSICNNVTTCNWSAGNSTCGNSGVGAEGVQCADINESSLCNGMPMLSTCCTWNGTACNDAPWTTACKNTEPPPEGASFCEDYNSIDDENLCNQIAGDPWYMPCAWNNNTNQCQFDSGNFFGGGSGDCSSITPDNGGQNACDAAGCEWVTDSYCSGGSLISSGHCEPSFGIGSSSCSSDCWACEFNDNGSALNSLYDAQTRCESSTLGYCQWETDPYAPNSFGWCNEPDEIHYGGGDCSQNCWDCDFMQNPQTACEGNPQCDWDPIQNSCKSSTERTCADECWSCYDFDSCTTHGQGGNNSCEWDQNNYICKPMNFNGEICTDGIDNDNDNYIDCGDPDCAFDDFCGGGGMSDCFNWQTNETCQANGCSWINDTWSGERCDFNGSQCFSFDDNQTACETDSDCEWFVPMGGGMCDINQTSTQPCFSVFNETVCTSAPLNQSCVWRTDEFNNSWCDGLINECFWNFTLQNNQTLCNENAYCNWTVDEWGSSCGSTCFSLDQPTCDTDPSCEFRAGFCNPEFFNPGGGFGGDMNGCFQYDFNETACGEQGECSWQTFPGLGFCEINHTANCFQYNESVCTNSSAVNQTCKWLSDPFGGSWCGDISEECFNNQTRQQNSGNCTQDVNGQSLCSWNNNHCEPGCFNSTLSNNETLCNAASGCAFKNGFCESSQIGQAFQGMEGGQPVILSTDDCPEGITPNSSDICSMGIKETENSYSFGTKVVSMSQAAACNGITLFGGGFGSGYDTSKFYWYLDTDGNDTNNCNSIGGNYTGFEFYMSYVSQWLNGSLSESKTVYRCANSSWSTSDISASTWNEFMCRDVGGAMMAVEKSDLNRFPDLYSRTADMRIYATTANNVTNQSLYVDATGPAYYTPGAVDFRFEDCGGIGVDLDGDGLTAENDPDCTDFIRYGYIPTEEGIQCADSIDNDNDNNTDCDDEGCWYDPICGGSFNLSYVSNLNDTTAPRIVKSNIEVFTDSAFVDYDTSEPANGTLVFHYNNTACTGGTNTTILSSAMLDSNMDNYTIWHDGPLDNFSFNPQPLDNELDVNTTYFYKITVCDPSDNCATSACLNFTTPASAAECTSCNSNFKFGFVPPSGSSPTDPLGAMQFSFDWDGDGVIDEIQGGTCGADAGVRLNHTQALGGGTMVFNNPNSTNNWSINFKNISLPSGLSSGLTNISDDTFLFNETETNATGTPQNATYIGVDTSWYLDAKDETNTKQIHLDIPGNWTDLWHCNYNTTTSNISGCMNITNQTFSGPAYNNTTDVTTWSISPDEGFSVYGGLNVGGYVSASSPGSPGSGSPGGGSPGGVASCTEDWACTVWSECVEGVQTMTCTDQNGCGTENDKPVETQSCTPQDTGTPPATPGAPPSGPGTGTGPSGGQGPSEPGITSQVPIPMEILLVVMVVIAVAVIAAGMKVKGKKGRKR